MLQLKERPSPAVHSSDDLLAPVERLMADLVAGPSASGAIRNARVTNAAMHHLESGGSRVRARMAIDSGLALGLNSALVTSLAASAELLHNASLIHDDLQDRDQMRRGVPTVWAMFGDHVALCVGDLFLSAAYAAVAGAGGGAPTGALIQLVHAATTAAIHGQCDGFDMGIALSGDLGRYAVMAAAKSGAILSLPLELVLAAANRTESLPLARRAAGQFAIGYQIADDLCDYQTDLGNGEQPPSANVIRILEAGGYAEFLFRFASQLGVRHLHEAVRQAASLPAHSGRMLAGLSKDLTSHFESGL